MHSTSLSSFEAHYSTSARSYLLFKNYFRIFGPGLTVTDHVHTECLQCPWFMRLSPWKCYLVSLGQHESVLWYSLLFVMLQTVGHYTLFTSTDSSERPSFVLQSYRSAIISNVASLWSCRPMPRTTIFDNLFRFRFRFRFLCFPVARTFVSFTTSKQGGELIVPTVLMDDAVLSESTELQSLDENKPSVTPPILPLRLRALQRLDSVRWRSLIAVIITVIDGFLVFSAVSLIATFFPTEVYHIVTWDQSNKVAYFTVYLNSVDSVMSHE